MRYYYFIKVLIIHLAITITAFINLGCNANNQVKSEEIVGSGNNYYDYYHRYTYIVLCKKNNRVVTTATGFFLKIENILYFLTNYHVATGFDPLTKTNNYDIDTLSVVLGDFSNSHAQMHFSVKRDLQMEQRIGGLEMIDVYPIRVSEKDAITLSINYLTNEIDTLPDQLIPDRIFFWTKSFGAGNIPQRVDSKLGFANYNTDYYLLRKVLKGRSDERINEMITKYSKIYFLSNRIGGLTHGNSGTPIFGEYLLGDEKRIQLIGICMGSNDIMERDEFAKIENILTFLSSKIQN